MNRILQVCLAILCSCYLTIDAEEDILKNYIDNYRYSEALLYIDKQPVNSNMQLQKALCYEKLNNYRKATEILLPLSMEFSEDKNIKLKLAICYQSLLDWNNSLNCYEDLIKLDSTIAYYKIQKADILFHLNRYEEALQQYKNLVNNNQLMNMIRRSALCFENMNLADSAIVYYNRAYEVDPTDNSSFANLITLYIKTQKEENYSMAINLSDMYVKKDSTNKQINLFNGLSYYASDLYEEAAKRFEKCILYGDTSLIVNRSLGISYYFLGENLKAFPYLSKAHEQDSTNLNILYSLAVVCNETSKPELAIKHFKLLLDKVIPPDMTLYLYYKGLATGQETLKMNFESVYNYKNAIKYGSENQRMSLYFTLASLLDYELKFPKDALVYYYKYRDSLLNYLELIEKTEDKDESNNREIQSTESKIKNLSTHIERLEKETNK